jgi:hypothetical protein
LPGAEREADMPAWLDGGPGRREGQGKGGCWRMMLMGRN